MGMFLLGVVVGVVATFAFSFGVLMFYLRDYRPLGY